jgi:hypothetical protein
MIRICNKNDIFKLGSYIYKNQENDEIGLLRKYNKWKQMFNLDKNDEC